MLDSFLFSIRVLFVSYIQHLISKLLGSFHCEETGQASSCSRCDNRQETCNLNLLIDGCGMHC